MRRAGRIPLPAGRRLPPGQHLLPDAPVMHYGPVPRPRPERWDFTIGGATADGAEHVMSLDDMLARQRLEVVAGLHCSAHWSTLDDRWGGVGARDLVAAVPPAPGNTEVLVFAEFGYSASITVDDLRSSRALLATHHDGEALSQERGGPLRLILPHLYSWKGPKWVRGWHYRPLPERGFWEQRGYHLRGDAWREERYSHLE